MEEALEVERIILLTRRLTFIPADTRCDVAGTKPDAIASLPRREDFYSKLHKLQQYNYSYD